MIRADRVVAAAFVVLVSTAIVGLSAGDTGASFTGTTTNPSQILQTSTVAAPASESAASAIAGRVDLSWPATTTPANGHAVTYLVLRNGVQVGTTATLAYSDTPGSDGTYAYTVETKIAQGAGFFTSPNSPSQNGISDRTAPTASITCAGGACSASWYTTVPAVVITGADAGSGVGTVTRNVDAAGNVAGASPMTIPALGQGTHTVAYFATDVAGNSNGAVTQTIKVDSVAPTTVIGLSAVTGANGPPVSVDLSWTAGTDSTSGVAGYVVYWSDAVATCAGATYPNSATIGAVTTYQISGLANNKAYCAYVVTTDNAGNLSANSATVGPTAAK